MFEQNPAGIFVPQNKSITGPGDSLTFRNIFEIDHYDNLNRFIDKYVFHNDITIVGKNALLDIMFRNQSQLANWYFGLVNNSGYTAFNEADTMSSHSGWAEFTSYDETTRVQWSPGAASSKSLTNSTPVTFTINASGNLKGIFVVSNSTKSGTSGTIWSGAAFGSVVPVNSGDQLKVTYTLNT